MKGIILWDKRVYNSQEAENSLKNLRDNQISNALIEGNYESGLSVFYTIIINDNVHMRRNIKDRIREQVLEQKGRIVDEIFNNSKKSDFYAIATSGRFEPKYNYIYRGIWKKDSNLGIKGRVAIDNLLERIDSGKFS